MDDKNKVRKNVYYIHIQDVLYSYLNCKIMHWHCESIELVIPSGPVRFFFSIFICLIARPRSCFPGRNSARFFVLQLLFLWTSRIAFYELSKTALSTRGIHKLAAVLALKTNCYLAKGLYRLAARFFLLFFLPLETN